ncbi:hypothetical protein [Actinoplanes nipponensis]|uniref:hypothetical protein n=1 Tax=Actinoplanes nipponensis TaxID=135950 RepID=UPI0031E80A93
MNQMDASRLRPRTKGDPYPHGLAEAVLCSAWMTDQGEQARRMLDRLAVLSPTGVDRHLATSPPPRSRPPIPMSRPTSTPWSRSSPDGR